MSDLPGPEKPPEFERHTVSNVNQMLAEFRQKMAAGQVKRQRPAGAGGNGAYDGRSGKQLKGKARDRHKMVVSLAVAGWKNNEIAQAMGYTDARVSVILNSKHPDLQSVRQDMVERVAQGVVDLNAKFQQYAPDALDVMVDVMKSDDLTQKRLAARDILDRAGYSPVKRIATVTARVPVEQLSGLMGQIEKANQAVARQGEWEVMEQQDGAA